MSGTYEPGRLYVATVRGEPDVRALRTLALGGQAWFCPVYQDTDIGNGWWPDDDEVTDVRPLVVLDPDDREQMDALCKALVNAAYTEREFSLAHSGIHPDTVTTALRSLTKPPEPEEVGPLVEFSADGRQYFVTTFLRKDFMATESDVKRLQLAEMVVQNGRVIKNRRGGVA